MPIIPNRKFKAAKQPAISKPLTVRYNPAREAVEIFWIGKGETTRIATLAELFAISDKAVWDAVKRAALVPNQLAPIYPPAGEDRGESER